MLPEKLRKEIEKKWGAAVLYPKDCIALSGSIQEHCGKLISSSTLKRLFGFTRQVEQPHRYTLDVLANYAGYRNYDAFLKYDTRDNSSFFHVKGVESKKLSAGNRMEFSYEPGRNVTLCYKGDDLFEVIHSEKSKLIAGDILRFSQVVLNYPLIIMEVIRNDVHLGKFTAGKLNGITGIKIIE